MMEQAMLFPWRMSTGRRALALVFVLFWLVLWPGLVGAQQQVTATLQPERPTLHVGDVVALSLLVTHPRGYVVEPPKMPAQWGAFEVRNPQSPRLAVTDDGATLTYDVTLWAPGDYQTPPLVVTVTDPDGQPLQVTVPPVTLTVEPLVTDPNTPLQPLKPQATVPLIPAWLGVLLAVVVLLLVAALYWWLRRRRRATAGAEMPALVVDNRPPAEVALARLADIARQDLPAQNRFKEHYTLLADTLRRYLEGAFGVPAMDMTTTELRWALSETGLPPEDQAALLHFFRACDLVKFADHIPMLPEARQMVDTARLLVERTRPRPQPAPETLAQEGEAAV